MANLRVALRNSEKAAQRGIDAAAKAASVTGKLAADYTPQQEKNNQLAQTLGFIVMPVSNGTPITIRVFPGAATSAQIQSAIQKAGN